jgi:hypothetical protein
MSIEQMLDPVHAYLLKRSGRSDGLTPEERIAVFILHANGKGYRVGLLADAFKVSRNTIYYKALTGRADSYPNSPRSNSAEDTQAVIDHLGLEEATRRFVTPAIVAKVKAAEERALARHRKRRR